MSGLYTPGVPVLGVVTGNEKLAVDTQLAAGAASPQTAAVGLVQLATALAMLGSKADITPVAGTRYIASVEIGSQTQLNGVAVQIGSVGGTNNLIVELHDATGKLVATSALAGVLAGAANTWQRIPFTAPYLAPAGRYFIAVQCNGTTARLSGYNAPSSPLLTSSATGTFGTSADITPPTSYTTGVGPVAALY